MIYLSGSVHPQLTKRDDTGFMLTFPFVRESPRRGSLDGTLWAADTGCFTRPEAFDTDKYIEWLVKRKQFASMCLFATAPDVVGDAVLTLERSVPVFSMIREAGFKAALVGQDGLEDLDIPWDDFDCLFIGGTTEWKLSEPAYSLVAEAKKRDKWAHQGRANSFRRLKAAALSGYDSADGTFLKFAPDTNIIRMERWFERLRQQPVMRYG